MKFHYKSPTGIKLKTKSVHAGGAWRPGNYHLKSNVKSIYKEFQLSEIKCRQRELI